VSEGRSLTYVSGCDRKISSAARFSFFKPVTFPNVNVLLKGTHDATNDTRDHRLDWLSSAFGGQYSMGCLRTNGHGRNGAGGMGEVMSSRDKLLEEPTKNPVKWERFRWIRQWKHHADRTIACSLFYGKSSFGNREAAVRHSPKSKSELTMKADKSLDNEEPAILPTVILC
jgi:hypothetical protein